jgi:ribosomal protein S19
MSRSKWKGNFLAKCLLKNSEKKNLKITSRQSVIPSFFIGKTVLVYSGKIFKKIFITREKVGFKFGDFCKTRNNKK